MSEATKPQEPKTTTSLEAMFAFFKPKPLAMLGLGFSSGLPYLLIFDTLSAWLRDVGVSLEFISFFILATFSYSLKFIWAPIIDRVNLPVLTPWLGHRRSWMILTQGLIILGLWGIAGTNPEQGLVPIAILATLTGFFSATQDIVMDAWRIEAVEADMQGIMAANYQWGYRIAMLVAGVLPLFLSESIGWGNSYALMATFMAVGVAAVLLAPRGNEHTIRAIHYDGLAPKPIFEALEWFGRAGLILIAAIIMGSGLTGKAEMLNSFFGAFGMDAVSQVALKTIWTAKGTGVFYQVPAVFLGLGMMIYACVPLPWKTRPGAYFQGTFIMPLADYFKRHKDWATFILVLIIVYRISEFVLNIMNPFYLDLGFEKETIAEVRKVFGVIMSMIGVGFAGWIIMRFGVKKSLVIGAIAGPFSHVGFMYLAMKGHDLGALSLAIAMDNIAASISGTVLIAYMSSLTTKGYTASQYAIFSSLYSILGKLVATQSGRIVEGTAKTADAGGMGGVFKTLMTHLPSASYAKPALKLGVTPEALGAGYFAFFAYTILIGLFAIIMAFWLYYRQGETSEDAPEDAPEKTT